MPISNITISNTFGQFRQAFNDSANAINSLPASIVTNVGAISPVSSSGGSTPSIGLNSAYGDSQNPYASKTANHVLAAPNAASGFPSFRALVANDIPTILNTLTLSGTTDASNAISGTLIVSGGVGIGKNLYVSGNTHISGNLVVLGSNTELSTTQINVNDPLLQLANNNTSDLIDIGIFGQYNSGAANLHSGIFRDATDGVWKLFNSYSAEPTTTINPSANGFAYADLNVNSLTLSGGTANGVSYLNSSKVLTTGSALTFDGFVLSNLTGATAGTTGFTSTNSVANGYCALTLKNTGASGKTYEIGVGGNGTSGNYQNNLYVRDVTGNPIIALNDTNTIFSASGSEQMRLNSTGLGIGTSSPSNKLVVSNAGAAGFEFDPTNGIMQTYNRSGAAYTATNLLASQINFKTGSSPATNMILDSSGNLGLGVTPSADTLGGKKFEIGFAGSTIQGYQAANLLMYNNATFNSGWKYSNTAGAAEYQQNGSQHIWYTAPSGTAGNAITFTQAMTLDASGNLGVGVTSIGGSRVYIAGGSLSSSPGNNGIAMTGGLTTGRLVTQAAGTVQSIHSFYDSSCLEISQGSTGTQTGIVINGGSTTNNPATLQFFTSLAERVRIDSSGNMLVGGTAARGTTVGSAHIDLFNGTAPAGTLTNGVSLYSSSGDLKFMDAAGNAYDVGFRNIPQNSQSAAYTLVLSDAGKHILHPASDANARTYTIPANSSVAYPIGTAITFVNMAAQVVTIAITTDTMYLSPAGTTGSRSLARYGSATALKISSTEWIISGSGLT